MANHSAVNLSSLSIVSAELEETLDLALRGWTSFRDKPSDFTSLKAAGQCFAQINGALHIVELRGMAMLSEELQQFTETTIANDTAPTDTVVKKIIESIECQARYLDYVRANGLGKPTLLIPAINSIRAFNRRPRLAEQFFTNVSIEGAMTLPEQDNDVELNLEKLSLTIRRLRQMYQTGLIGVLRSDPPAMHLGLMQRACERMYGVLRSQPAAGQWVLKAAVIGGLASDQLELTGSRTQLLSLIDRSFKELLTDLPCNIAQPADNAAATEYLYLISLLDAPGPMAKLACSNVTVAHEDLENRLREERAYVYGINSAIEEQRLLKMSTLLGSIHEYLDTASRANTYASGDLDHLGSQLDELIALLGTDVGRSLADILTQRRKDVTRWVAQPDSVTWDGLMPLADALIMVDGTLEQARAAAGEQQDIVEKADASALQSAELAVVTEAQAGLSIAKRAITSYVESGYDRVHLGNIATTLNTVRGGLQLLHLKRASDILVRSTRFIESTIDAQNNEDYSVLETLADALISLEYYLGQLELRRDADDSVLDVADESLREIGYPAAVA